MRGLSVSFFIALKYFQIPHYPSSTNPDDSLLWCTYEPHTQISRLCKDPGAAFSPLHVSLLHHVQFRGGHHSPLYSWESLPALVEILFSNTAESIHDSLLLLHY